MKTYEITYLTVLEEGNDAKSIASILGSHSAKIVSIHPWGNRRKLTHVIKKQDQAFYTTAVFDSEPSTIAAIQRELHLSSDIIRALIVEFDPGIFHRSAIEEGIKAKPAEKTEAPLPVTPESEITATPVSAAITETPTTTPEPAKEEGVTEEKPKRRRTKKTKDEEKVLDEKLDALLNEDITK